MPASVARSLARLAVLGGPPSAGVESLILGFSWRNVMKTKAAWIAGGLVGIASLGGGLGLSHRVQRPTMALRPGDREAGGTGYRQADPGCPGGGRPLPVAAGRQRPFCLGGDELGRKPSFAEAARNKTVETSRKLLDLIEQDPRDPESLRAMTWHVHRYWPSGLEGPLVDELSRSVYVLIRHYADEPRIAFRVLVRPSNIPVPFDDHLIPLLAASARRRETRSLALMVLGQYLEEKARMVLRIQAVRGRFHAEVEPGKTWESPLSTEAYEKTLRESDAVALFAEAEAVFARVVTEFADVMQPMRCPDDEGFITWVEPARGSATWRAGTCRSFSLWPSVVLCRSSPRPAADGRATRLSDLRGKVVLLSFRQVGEGPFEDEPEYTAGHAARLKGRPFRAWWPLTRRTPRFANVWVLGRSAAAILVDAAGRFRFQGQESRLLGGYIDAVVKEAEAGERLGTSCPVIVGSRRPLFASCTRVHPTRKAGGR